MTKKQDVHIAWLLILSSFPAGLGVGCFEFLKDHSFQVYILWEYGRISLNIIAGIFAVIAGILISLYFLEMVKRVVQQYVGFKKFLNDEP